MINNKVQYCLNEFLAEFQHQKAKIKTKLLKNLNALKYYLRKIKLEIVTILYVSIKGIQRENEKSLVLLLRTYHVFSGCM